MTIMGKNLDLVSSWRARLAMTVVKDLLLDLDTTVDAGMLPWLDDTTDSTTESKIWIKT